MTANELLRIFLKDEQITERYGITKMQSDTLKVTDESPIFFVKILQQCVLEYEHKNMRAATNLKNFVENNIPSDLLSDSEDITQKSESQLGLDLK